MKEFLEGLKAVCKTAPKLTKYVYDYREERQGMRLFLRPYGYSDHLAPQAMLENTMRDIQAELDKTYSKLKDTVDMITVIVGDMDNLEVKIDYKGRV